MFDCEVRHSYSEPVSGLSGYDCYDGGEHVDGHKGTAGASQPGQVLYLVSDEPALPAQEAASYREVRGKSLFLQLTQPRPCRGFTFRGTSPVRVRVPFYGEYACPHH